MTVTPFFFWSLDNQGVKNLLLKIVAPVVSLIMFLVIILLCYLLMRKSNRIGILYLRKKRFQFLQSSLHYSERDNLCVSTRYRYEPKWTAETSEAVLSIFRF